MLKYEGALSTLEIKINPNAEDLEKQICTAVNWLLYYGKTSEKQGRIDTSSTYFQTLIKEIHDYPQDWKILESRLFKAIENYIKFGSKGEYTFECNDICLGTLKFVAEFYKTGKDLTYLDHQKLADLTEYMSKICAMTAQTIKNSKGTKKACPNGLGKFEDGNSSNLRHKKRKLQEDDYEAQKYSF